MQNQPNHVGTQTQFDDDSVCTSWESLPSNSGGIEGVDAMETDDDPDMQLDNMTELELESEILKEIDEYVQYNLLGYSSPTFHEDLIDYVLDSTYDAAVQCNIMEESESNYQQLQELVSTLVENYFHTMNIHVVRSYPPHTKVPIQNVDQIRTQIAHLKSLPQPPQRTPEWYAHRHNLITASNIYKALGSDALYNSLVCEKCKPLITQGQGKGTEGTQHKDASQPEYGCGNHAYSEGLRRSPPEYVNTQSSLHWGNKYEPVSVMVYEAMFPGCVVDSAFGCIVHPHYAFLGASPDGIVVAGSREGHMVEIKNRVSKDITGIPSLAYWTQTQVQMEVCELEYCDLFETSFKEFADEDAFYENAGLHEYRGVILYLVSRKETGIPRYEYMSPMKVCEDVLERTAVNAWIQERRNEAGKDFIQVEVQYWYLNEVSCVIIPRNRAWFQAALPRFQDIWATIERERVSGYEHRLPKKRTQTHTVSDLRSFQSGGNRSLLPPYQPPTEPTMVVRKLGAEPEPTTNVKSNILDGLLASLAAGEP
jgi:YqaJ-like viral recombinase domain